MMNDEISLNVTGQLKMFNHTKLPSPPQIDGTMIRYRSHYRGWCEKLKKWVELD